MQRTLTRELRLTEEEVCDAIKYWLINKHDVQIGENPNIEFDGLLYECKVISSEEAVISLTQGEG